jgi:hypothetical protein
MKGLIRKLGWREDFRSGLEPDFPETERYQREWGFVSFEHFHVIPSGPQVVEPGNLQILINPALTSRGSGIQNPDSAGAQVPGAADGGSAETQDAGKAKFGLTEIKGPHE